MTDERFVIRTAQAIGLTTSSFLSSHILSFSYALVPTLILPAAGNIKRSFDSGLEPGTPIGHIATQWRHAYHLGRSTAPFIALASSAAYTYLAYAFREGTGVLHTEATAQASNLYLVAALLSLGIVPFTLAVMKPTNDKLMERAAATDAGKEGKGKGVKGEELVASREDAEVRGWLEKWCCLNCARACFPIAATLLAVSATFY
ncbi:hypothetical protein AJ80_09814 [Polytolypa hystricis UAMH7299]|uniref:DUF1772 domain-containing protein n=1 Tax=Polytolypa hystricis (strain UAMH7299) TaxID=1447883 RepID=A0A2B7WIZ4_POLH7|nr:hypothetical protein AJ80_09814 [Polytolypa hystricis UAMH7299]